LATFELDMDQSVRSVSLTSLSMFLRRHAASLCVRVFGALVLRRARMAGQRDLVPSSGKAVLCTPDAVCADVPSVSDLLTTRARGAYTGARTVGRHSVFHWRFHVRRIGACWGV